MSAFMWRPLVVMAVAMLMACAPATANAAFGDLDASFGVGGKQRDVAGGTNGPSQIRVQADGGVLFAGAQSLFQLDAVSRRHADGSPDTQFGSGGFLRGPEKHLVADFELLADARIAVLYSGPDRRGMLSVYRPGGGLDWTFDFAGNPQFRPASLAVQGSALLVSGALPPTTAAIMRVTGSGELDPTFGNAGLVSMEGFIGGGPGYSAIAVGRNESILLGLDRKNSSSSTDGGQRIARFDANGSLDASFDTAGLKNAHNGYNALGVRDLEVSPSGNLLAVLRFGFPGSKGGFAIWDQIVHVSPSGAPVTPSSRNSLSASSIWMTGGLTDAVAMPGSGFATVYNKQVAVLTEDRKPDTSFDLNGVTTVAVGSLSTFTSIDSMPDGKLVIGGAYIGRSNDGKVRERSTVARLLGFAGGVSAPQPRLGTVFSPVYWLGKRRAPKLLKIEGVANPVGDLRGVGIAIRRIDKPLLRRGRCRWVTRGGRASRTVRKRSTGCNRPIFMPAKLGAKGEWTFDFKRRLTAGSYQAYVRATKSDGTHNPLNDDSDSFASFKVKKYRRR